MNRRRRRPNPAPPAPRRHYDPTDGPPLTLRRSAGLLWADLQDSTVCLSHAFEIAVRAPHPMLTVRSWSLVAIEGDQDRYLWSGTYEGAHLELERIRRASSADPELLDTPTPHWVDHDLEGPELLAALEHDWDPDARGPHCRVCGRGRYFPHHPYPAEVTTDSDTPRSGVTRAPVTDPTTLGSHPHPDDQGSTPREDHAE